MSASDYIAVCATVVALASLYVAVRQNSLSQRHNRLSVRPLLAIYRRQFENHPIEYIIENRGLGPAIVDDFSVWVDDHPVTSPEGNPIYSALDRLNISHVGVGGHLVPAGEALRPGQEICLLKFSDSAGNPALFESLTGKLPRLKFKINYASIYEEKFELYGNG